MQDEHAHLRRRLLVNRAGGRYELPGGSDDGDELGAHTFGRHNTMAALEPAVGR